MNRNELLTISLLSNVIGAGVILWSSWWSDRIGRRPLILIGAAALILWAFPYFWLVNTTQLVLFFAAVTIGSIFQSMTYGPLAAYMGELFAPRVRSCPGGTADRGRYRG